MGAAASAPARRHGLRLRARLVKSATVAGNRAVASLLSTGLPLQRHMQPTMATEAGGRMTLVVDNRLQRNEFDVSRDGTISASYQVLADGLPFPIAL